MVNPLGTLSRQFYLGGVDLSSSTLSNTIIRQCFELLSWQIRDYRPSVSRLGYWQAVLPGISPVLRDVAIDWVPCFHQRDIAAVRRYAARTETATVH